MRWLVIVALALWLLLRWRRGAFAVELHLYTLFVCEGLDHRGARPGGAPHLTRGSVRQRQTGVDAEAFENADEVKQLTVYLHSRLTESQLNERQRRRP